jgi:hypothetical protein
VCVCVCVCESWCVSSHNIEKKITTKTRNPLGDKVKGTLTEVKMSRIRKRSDLDQEKKSIHFFSWSRSDLVETYTESHRVGCGMRKNGQVSVTVSAGRRGQAGETGVSQTNEHC